MSIAHALEGHAHGHDTIGLVDVEVDGVAVDDEIALVERVVDVVVVGVPCVSVTVVDVELGIVVAVVDGLVL